MDQNRLQQRASGRSLARDVLGVAFPDLTQQRPSVELAEAFLDELRDALIPPTLAQRQEEQRTLLELSQCALSFGKYQNVPLPDVDRDYLHWMVKSCEDNKNMLVEYLERTKHLDEED